MPERRVPKSCASAAVATIVPTSWGSHFTPDLTRWIRSVFSAPFVEVIPYTLETADYYAGIRAQHGVSPADSIHLACAAQSGIDLFLTNEEALVGKVIPGIQFIAGLDTNLF